MTLALRPDNRLFLAADPPDGLRDRLAGLAREAVERWGGRAVPHGNLHVTLCFLGRVDPAAGDALAGAVAALGARTGPASVRIARLAGTPGRGPSPLCAAELEDLGGLAELLTEGPRLVLAAIGRPPEHRPPWAHVTLARFRRPTPLVPFPTDDEQVFAIDRVSLYDSRQAGAGAGAPRYVPVTGIRLGTVHSL
ncbi:MAG: hypothetical protein IT200_05370 [Thermoleophilia bacterium]|nr:hypothetical protein [Thermoleophilia bacterium]